MWDLKYADGESRVSVRQSPSAVNPHDDPEVASTRSQAEGFPINICSEQLRRRHVIIIMWAWGSLSDKDKLLSGPKGLPENGPW